LRYVPPPSKGRHVASADVWTSALVASTGGHRRPLPDAAGSVRGASIMATSLP